MNAASTSRFRADNAAFTGVADNKQERANIPAAPIRYSPRTLAARY